MYFKLSTPEIRAILQGCQYTLRLVGSSRDYRKIQSSEHFSTSNDVVLNDAVSVLSELVLLQLSRQSNFLNKENQVMEQEIKNAIGLGNPELVIESKPKPEPEPKPTVTIYDFSSLLSKHEPPKKQR
ncbi:hypothetical protein [Nostoc sp.]